MEDWRAEFNEYTNTWEIFEAKTNALIAKCGSGKGYAKYAFWLAACPDMYEALEAFEEYVSTNYPANIRLKQIAVERMEQALAKAK